MGEGAGEGGEGVVGVVCGGGGVARGAVEGFFLDEADVR